MGDKEFPSIFGSASALRAVKPQGRGPTEGEEVAGARLGERLGEGLTGYHFRGQLRGEEVSVHLLREGVTEERRAKFQSSVDQLRGLTEAEVPAAVLRPLTVNDDRTALTLPAIACRPLEGVRGEGPGLSAHLEIIASLAEALEHLHRLHLAHGALSPSAVYVSDAGAPVIAGCSGTNLFLGTIGDSVEPQAFHSYASPEAKEGTGVDARSDIFSLGKLIYFLVTCAHPESTDGDLSRLESLRDAPRGLMRIIRKCTCRRPEDRYQDIDAFLADLVHNDDADVGTAPGAGDEEPQRRARVKLPARFDRRAREREADAKRAKEARGAEKAQRAEDRALEKARLSAEEELGLREPRRRWTPRTGLGLLGAITFAAAFVLPFIAHPIGSQLAPAAAVLGGALATFLIRGTGPHGAYYELAAAALAAIVVFGADPTSITVSLAAEHRLTGEDPATRAAAARFLASRGHRSFVDADLEAADLDELFLEEADFGGAQLQGAALTRSDLRGASLRGANISGADLSGADLSEADLSGAQGGSTATCDRETRLPAGWQCRHDRLLPDGDPSNEP